MGKSFKVKSGPSRVALVEFLVEKRVRFLEYLHKLHQSEVLWMGTVRLSRQDVLRYFRRSDTSACGFTEYRMSPDLVGTASAESAVGDVAVTVRNIEGVPNAVGALWLARYIPCYLSLIVSLADLLRAPLTSQEFAECLYAMLLELNVHFAASATQKSAAQRNLRHYRNHQHPNFLPDACSSLKLTVTSAGNSAIGGGSSSSNGGGGGGSSIGVSAAFGSIGSFLHSAWDTESEMRYAYLNTEHHAYMTPAEVSYEELIIPFCLKLIIAYRRLCDYDAARNEDFVKHVLSIDHHLQCFFFSVISKELSRIAHGKLLQQMLLLSNDGLFARFGGTDRNTHYLLQGLVKQPSIRTPSVLAGTRGNIGSSSRESMLADLDDEEEEYEW